MLRTRKRSAQVTQSARKRSDWHSCPIKRACEHLERRALLTIFAGSDTFNTPAGTPLTINPIDLLSNDSGVNRITAITQPQNGVVTAGTGGSYVYAPNAGFVGTDQFTYTAATDTGVPGSLLIIPPIPGRTTAGAQLQIQSYTFGLRTPPTATGTTSSLNSSFDNLVLNVDMGSASPGIFSALVQRQAITGINLPLQLVTRDANNRRLLRWQFSTVSVVGIESVDDQAASPALKRVSLAVAQARIAVTQYDSGNPLGTTAFGSWDRSNPSDPGLTTPFGTVSGGAAPSKTVATRSLNLGGTILTARSATGGGSAAVTTVLGVNTAGTPDLKEFTFQLPLQAQAASLFGKIGAGVPIAPTVTYSVSSGSGQPTTTWTLGDARTAGTSVFGTSIQFAVDSTGEVNTQLSLACAGFTQTSVEVPAGAAAPATSTSATVSLLTPSTRLPDFGGLTTPATAGGITLQLNPAAGRGGSLPLASYSVGADLPILPTGTGQATARQMVLTLPAGAASTGFIDMLAGGVTLASATITARDDNSLIRNTITVSGFCTADVQLNDSGDVDPAARPTMTLTLVVGAVSQSHAPLVAGSKPPATGTPINATVNFAQPASTTGALVSGGDDQGSRYRVYFVQRTADIPGSTLLNTTPYIDVTEADWSSTRPAAFNPNGTPAGTLNLKQFNFTAFTGRQTPGLLASLATARTYDRAIVYRRSDTGQLTTAWTLGTVLVSGYESSGNLGSALTDHVQLTYNAISTTTYLSNGTIASAPSGWDRVSAGPSTLAPYSLPSGVFNGSPEGDGGTESVIPAGGTLSVPAVSGAPAATFSLNDYRFSVTNSSSIVTQPVTGNTDFNVLTVSRPFDDNYNSFLRTSGAGTVYSQLTLTSTATPDQPFAQFTFDNAVVSQVQVSMPDGSVLIETIQFFFQAMTESFTPYNGSGVAQPTASARHSLVTAATTGSGFDNSLTSVPSRTAEITFNNGPSIAVQSAQWTGASANPSGTTSALLGEFTFVTAFDRQSIGVFQNLAAGTVLGSAIYTIRDDTGRVLGSWRLGGELGTGLVITSQQVEGAGDGSVLHTFTLNTNAITEAASASLTDGGTATQFGFSRITNQPTVGSPVLYDFGNAIVPPVTFTATGTVTIQVLAPTLLSTTFDFSTREAIVFTFATRADSVFSRGSFTLTRLSTGQVVPASTGAFSWNSAGTQATLLLTTLLTDANYRVTRGTSTFDFYVLAGDANRDRTVNFDDLLILASNYNATDRTFTQGDFNYDGTVNFDDLLILASRYNTSLPAAAAPLGLAAAGPTAGMPVGVGPVQEDDAPPRGPSDVLV